MFYCRSTAEHREHLMIVIIGLVFLVAAVVAAVAGVLSNGGQGHAVTHFAALGYHVTGSTGTLFLYGIVVGAIGMAGLGLLLAGARRTSRRGSAARRGLRQSRQETAAVSRDRDDLIGQRENARAHSASTLDNSTPARDSSPGRDDSRPGGLHRFGRRDAPVPAAAGSPERLNGKAV